MKTIAVIGQKGGPGKTTVCENLAVAAAAAGERVTLVDLDPQSTAADWGDRREAGGDPAAADNPLVQSAQAARLPKLLEAAKRTGTTLVILDTPPHSAEISIAAARAASLVLVPVRPSIKDLGTLPAVRDMLATAGRPRALVVLNGVPPKDSRRHAEAAEVARSHGFEVAPIVWRTRNPFADAAAPGLGVTEFEPAGACAAEVLELLRYITAKPASRKANQPTNRADAHP